MTDSLDPRKLLVEAVGTGRQHEEASINSYCSLVAPDVLWLTRLLSNERREVRLLAARTLLSLDRTTTAEETHPVTQAAATMKTIGFQSVAGIGCVLVLTVICVVVLTSNGLPLILAIILLVWPFARAWQWMASDRGPARNPPPMLLKEDEGHSLAAINRLVELGVTGDRMVRDDCVAALSPVLPIVDEYDSIRIRHDTILRLVRMAGSRDYPIQFRLDLLKCLGKVGNRGCLGGLTLTRDDPQADIPIPDAAQKAIEAIRARDSSQSLLRPSAIPADEALLRPAGGTAAKDDTLLKPSERTLE